MGTPLCQARGLLQTTARKVQKVVLIITDGDPNDLSETEEAVAALHAAGALLVFVKVGQDGDVARLRALGGQGSQSQAQGQNQGQVQGQGHLREKQALLEVLETPSYSQLGSLVPDVMKRIVKVTQIVQ